MKEATPPPSLAELAQPYKQPGALPPGISEAVGVIASTAPGTLAAALQTIRIEGGEAYQTAFSSLTRGGAEDSTVNILGTYTGDESEVLESLEKVRGLHQDVIGHMGTNYMPSADSVSHLAGALDRLEGLAQVRDRLNLSHAEVSETRQDRVAAAQRLHELREPLVLSEQIGNDIARLSRRGQLLSTIAGGVFGALAALGLFVTADQVLHAKMANAPAAVRQHEERFISGQNIEVVLAGTGAAAFLMALAGAEVGSNNQGRFARRRANKLIREARSLES